MFSSLNTVILKPNEQLNKSVIFHVPGVTPKTKGNWQITLDNNAHGTLFPFNILTAKS